MPREIEGMEKGSWKCRDFDIEQINWGIATVRKIYMLNFRFDDEWAQFNDFCWLSFKILIVNDLNINEPNSKRIYQKKKEVKLVMFSASVWFWSNKSIILFEKRLEILEKQ